MKKIFSLLAVAALIFASCSKDNEGGHVAEGDEIQFYLKIAQQNEKTRADAGQVANGTKVNFTEGAIFFADASGKFVRYVQITNKLITGAVSAAELEEGYLFNGISNTAETVYVIGGYDFSGHPSIGSKSDLEQIKVDLASQSDYAYGVLNASLAGSGAIVAKGAGQVDRSALTPNAQVDYDAATHEAYIEVRPLIARLEIKAVTGLGLDDGWQLDGIYVDNIFYESTLFGDYDAADWNEYAWTDPGDTYDKYDRLNASSVYSTPAWNPILFDDGSWDYTTGNVDPAYATTSSNLGAGTYPNSITPSKSAWAYNFFADAGNVPNIVLALSNVAHNGTLVPNKTMEALVGEPGYTHASGDYDGVRFLTVTGYNDSNNGGAAVNIRGGYVYVINDLKFKAGGDNTTPGGDGNDDTRDEPKGPEDPDDPDPNKKYDVFVQIELMDWTTVDVDVEFN